MPRIVYMTGDEYKAAVEAVGLSVRNARKFFDIDESTTRRYRAGTANVPKPVAMLLRAMLARGLTFRDVDMWTDPTAPTLTKRQPGGHAGAPVTRG